ncbi:hypothetical protein GCM10023169_01840 [Georgenia halophila]|uniref:Sulfotransferase family protein n=1 Tax=Georgenia halophila TaxID=620889 RepID=A0ABP8KTG3_9MICO
MISQLPAPIFVGGLQRSGTTLVGRLVAQHPAVTGLVGTHTGEDEGQFVQDVYLTDHEMGSRRGSKRGLTMRWAYHPEAHLTEDDLPSRPDAAERLVAAWSAYFEEPTAAAFVEKSPSNLTRTRFLQATFPAARFVILTRNPVVQALATRKWLTRRMQVGSNFAPVIEHWLEAMSIYERDEPHLEESLVVRYEHLLSNPQGTMDRIWSHLGLESIDVLKGIRNENDKYVEYWAAMQQGIRGARALHPLNPRTRRLSILPRSAERIVVPATGKRSARHLRETLDHRIAHFGYSLDDLTAASTWPDPVPW